MGQIAFMYMAQLYENVLIKPSTIYKKLQQYNTTYFTHNVFTVCLNRKRSCLDSRHFDRFLDHKFIIDKGTETKQLIAEKKGKKKKSLTCR